MGRALATSRQDKGVDYRRVLLEKRAEVLSSLGMKFDSVAAMGRVAEEDQAQIWHDEFIALRLNSLDYEKLRMVEEALERLSSGDFGACLGCEEPISPKRLKAVPWARYCVACQERLGSTSPDRDLHSLAGRLNAEQ